MCWDCDESRSGSASTAVVQTGSLSLKLLKPSIARKNFKAPSSKQCWKVALLIYFMAQLQWPLHPAIAPQFSLILHYSTVHRRSLAGQKSIAQTWRLKSGSIRATGLEPQIVNKRERNNAVTKVILKEISILSDPRKKNKCPYLRPICAKEIVRNHYWYSLRVI